MEKMNIEKFSHLVKAMRPQGEAVLKGSEQLPNLGGAVRFYPAGHGTLVVAEVFGLPDGEHGAFHAFHLHEGASCGSAQGADPFAAAKGHYNPGLREHPDHAGDFPPLLSNGGYAYMSFYTDRFQASEAVGKTVIVHRHGDDLHTQPSGDAGAKLACGVVYAV